MITNSPFKVPFLNSTILRSLWATWPLLILLSHQALAGTDPAEQILNSWLNRQAQVKSWSADVLQIRKLKSLVRPLESKGRVWFAQPNRFRWQLGEPPRTIATRTDRELVIVYPRLKQVERYPISAASNSAWKEAMALLDVGFPSDPKAFHSRYELISTKRSQKGWVLELRPAAKEALRLLERVRLEVTADDFILLATELVFPDGSTMRNQFSNHRLNPELEETLFEAEIGEGYQVINPLEGHK